MEPSADGEGTLLATEPCLLHPNRNPELRRGEVERRLGDFPGVERIVWLAHGLAEDRDTDGHVDLVAAFTRPGEVLLQSARRLATPTTSRWPRTARGSRQPDSPREVVGVPGVVLAYGGGGPHCITQQVPAAA